MFKHNDCWHTQINDFLPLLQVSGVCVHHTSRDGPQQHPTERHPGHPAVYTQGRRQPDQQLPAQKTNWWVLDYNNTS